MAEIVGIYDVGTWGRSIVLPDIELYATGPMQHPRLNFYFHACIATGMFIIYTPAEAHREMIGKPIELAAARTGAVVNVGVDWGQLKCFMGFYEGGAWRRLVNDKGWRRIELGEAGEQAAEYYLKDRSKFGCRVKRINAESSAADKQKQREGIDLEVWPSPEFREAMKAAIGKLPEAEVWTFDAKARDKWFDRWSIESHSNNQARKYK